MKRNNAQGQSEDRVDTSQHMERYLNNAGAGLMSLNTYEIITAHLQLEREIGAIHAAKAQKDQTEQFYDRAASLVKAKESSEIAFMDSASRGLNMVIQGANLHQGDRIVTLSSEFGTNLLVIYEYAQKIGAEVDVISCTPEGDFSLEEIEKSLECGARMAVISHMAAQCSIVNPVKEIGSLCEKYGALFIVDGCHAAGQIEVDVESMKCDSYIGTGRKWLCGPRGTGFIYVKESAPLRTTQLDLSSSDLEFDNCHKVLGVKIRTDARQFELWERNMAGMLGLSSAINEYLSKDWTTVSGRIRELSNQLRDVVAKNSSLKLLGKLDSESGIVGFYLKDPAQENMLKDEFEKAGIGISTISDWDCPLYFPRTGSSIIFRLSPHYYTKESTVNLAGDIISRL